MIFMPFIVVGLIALAGFVVMEMWNWLMPAIFGLGVITFWQALGIIILSKILFGGFRMGGCGGCCGYGYKHGGHWKHKFKHKWANMSDEDKEKWRKKFGDKCVPETETVASTEASGSEGETEKIVESEEESGSTKPDDEGYSQ